MKTNAEHCAPCQPFVAYTEELFGDTLDRYGFEFVRCRGGYEGRECRVMYRSPQAALLFILQDGETLCLLGDQLSAFPQFDLLLHGNGKDGWYQVRYLAGIHAGKPLLTRSLIREMREGRRSYYEWQAALLAEHADQLLPLLDPTRAEELQARVEYHRRSLPIA